MTGDKTARRIQGRFETKEGGSAAKPFLRNIPFILALGAMWGRIYPEIDGLWAAQVESLLILNNMGCIKSLQVRFCV